MFFGFLDFLSWIRSDPDLDLNYPDLNFHELSGSRSGSVGSGFHHYRSVVVSTLVCYTDGPRFKPCVGQDFFFDYFVFLS